MRKKAETTIDKVFYHKLGEILNNERRKKGYSLRYLAELTGITRTTLDNYEMGKHHIDYTRWKKICEALEMSDKIYVKIAIGLKEYE